MPRILGRIIEQRRGQQLAIGGLDTDLLGEIGRDRRGEANPCLFDRIAPGLRVDTAAFEARGEGLAHGIVEALVGTCGLAAGPGDVRAPHQRHVGARRQGTAALQCGHPGIGLGTLGGRRNRSGEPGAFQEVAHVPIVGAHFAQQLAGHIGCEHFNRDLLANALDRAIGVAGNRGRGGGQVGGDQEDLIFLNLAIILAGQHGARDRAAGVDRKLLLPGHGITRHALQPGAQLELADGAAG
ncbi:hypothetical protein D9M73_114560 [compost metagenome]